MKVGPSIYPAGVRDELNQVDRIKATQVQAPGQGRRVHDWSSTGMSGGQKIWRRSMAIGSAAWR